MFDNAADWQKPDILDSWSGDTVRTGGYIRGGVLIDYVCYKTSHGKGDFFETWNPTHFYGRALTARAQLRYIHISFKQPYIVKRLLMEHRRGECAFFSRFWSVLQTSGIFVGKGGLTWTWVGLVDNNNNNMWYGMFRCALFNSGKQKLKKKLRDDKIKFCCSHPIM